MTTADSDAVSATTIRAVLFDFAGVLTQPIAEAFAVCAARAGVDESLLRSVLVPMFLSADDTDLPAHRLERGEISLETFLATLNGDAVPVRRLLDPASPSFVVGEFRPSLPMQAFAEELGQAGRRIAVVSNTVREWLPAWEAGLTDPGLFDALVYSSEVGTRKPSPAIFELTLAKLGIRPEEALVLDDSLANAMAARDMGMGAIHVTDHATAIAEARRVCFAGLGLSLIHI